MATRFTDDLFNNTEGSDFIVRKRIPLAAQICLIFAIAFLAIYISASLMSERGSKLLFFITLSLSIGSLTGFTVYFSARLRDLVLATEFQNAMLASAAQLSTRFCLIIKRDGSIVYVDPGFQKFFPHFMRTPDRHIDGLLLGAGVSQDIIQNILLILQQDRNDRVLLPLRRDNGEPMPIMMSVELLPRPRGYFLLRGRDYVEKRNTEVAQVVQATNDAPLAQTLNLMAEGIFITDGGGGIVFINHALEEWLGFEAGETLARHLKMNQIIYQYGGMDAGRLINSDFDGEFVLQRRDRTLVSMPVRQVSLGKSAGVSAIVTLSQNVKKK